MDSLSRKRHNHINVDDNSRWFLRLMQEPGMDSTSPLLPTAAQHVCHILSPFSGGSNRAMHQQHRYQAGQIQHLILPDPLNQGLCSNKLTVQGMCKHTCSLCEFAPKCTSNHPSSKSAQPLTSLKCTTRSLPWGPHLGLSQLYLWLVQVFSVLGVSLRSKDANSLTKDCQNNVFVNSSVCFPKTSHLHKDT
jgi:hypothetical protein